MPTWASVVPVKASIEASPPVLPPLLVVMATCGGEEPKTLLPKLQVISGTGSPMAVQEKFAVPPVAVTTSLGCWVKEGGKGWTAWGWKRKNELMIKQNTSYTNL